MFVGIAAYTFLRSHVYRAPGTVHADALRLHTLDGKPVDPGALAGRVIVLNFWAPWCPPCREEMPWLDALQREHPEIAVLGIEDDLDAVEQARQLAQKQPVSYKLVLANAEERNALGRISLLPTTLYINATGRVVHTVSGVVPELVMREYLADTLALR